MSWYKWIKFNVIQWLIYWILNERQNSERGIIIAIDIDIQNKINSSKLTTKKKKKKNTFHSSCLQTVFRQVLTEAQWGSCDYTVCSCFAPTFTQE